MTPVTSFARTRNGMGLCLQGTVHYASSRRHRYMRLLAAPWAASRLQH